MGWFDILLGVGAAIAAGAAVALVCDYIDRQQIKKEALKRARERALQAVKAQILEKKKNAVNVGIFDRTNEEVDRFQIEAKDGVDPDLRVGQMIPLEGY
mgnify:FL=1